MKLLIIGIIVFLSFAKAHFPKLFCGLRVNTFALFLSLLNAVDTMGRCIVYFSQDVAAKL